MQILNFALEKGGVRPALAIVNKTTHLHIDDLLPLLPDEILIEGWLFSVHVLVTFVRVFCSIFAHSKVVCVCVCGVCVCVCVCACLFVCLVLP
jgi:hypothetical protein